MSLRWCKQISTKRTQVFELTAIEISDDSSKLGTTKLDRPLNLIGGLEHELYLFLCLELVESK